MKGQERSEQSGWRGERLETQKVVGLVGESPEENDKDLGFGRVLWTLGGVWVRGANSRWRLLPLCAKK